MTDSKTISNEKKKSGMHDPALVEHEIVVATQAMLDIEEIKDGTLVMKTGSLRAVLMVSSINFSLKATEEQEAIIAGYQEFLNSLDFPIQVLIQSRLLEIDEYVNKLNQQALKQTNELLRIQTAEYAEYIKELVDMAQIMSKDFYVIVPFDGIAQGESKKKLLSSLKPATKVILDEKDFEQRRLQLLQRVNHIRDGLEGLGLQVVPLETQELIELMYNTYNPESFQQQKLAAINDLEVS